MSKKNIFLFTSLIMFFLTLVFITNLINNISHAAYVRAIPESTGQELVDPSLKVELVFKDGL